MIDTSETAKAGQRIYDEKLKKLLEPTHVGQYVVIDVDSGKYAVGNSPNEALTRAKAVVSEGKFYMIRIGLGGALRLSSPSWTP